MSPLAILAGTGAITPDAVQECEWARLTAADAGEVRALTRLTSYIVDAGAREPVDGWDLIAQVPESVEP